MTKQKELFKRLTDREVFVQVLLSQFILLIIALFASLFMFDTFADLTDLFTWNLPDILIYALGPAVIVVLIDILLMQLLPKGLMDDGGINEKIFRKRSLLQIVFICLIVAISEELLFRGVIQTQFGYLTASLIFALIHFRYLTKPILISSIFILSFYLGYIYEVTNNLLVPIVAHFFIDFLLALYIRFRKEA